MRSGRDVAPKRQACCGKEGGLGATKTPGRSRKLAALLKDSKVCSTFGADICEDDAELFIRRILTVRRRSVDFRKTLSAWIT